MTGEPQQGQPPPPPQWGPPQQQPQQQWGQPPPQHGQPPPQWGQPQWQQPQWQQPYYGQSPYGYGSPWATTYYAPRGPDNSNGLAALILSLSAIGTLIITFGFLSPITAGVAIGGMVTGHKGLKSVESGATTRRKDEARWGFWLGLVGLILSILAVVGWVLVFVYTDDWDSDYEYDEGDPARAAIAAAGTLVRAAAQLVG